MIGQRIEIARLWKKEFSGYNLSHFQRDLVAGLTVAAVALPLALAFGIASGSTPAAGLITAIVAGFVIGCLSGAPYQISGPTGAMSAILILIVQKHGLPGLWKASLVAGIIILLLGLFKLGRIVNFIPAPVITGFTSGIAVIIFTGQVDNFFGFKTPAADSTALKILGYFTNPFPSINWQAVMAALIVVAAMLILPRFKLTHKLPAALIGISISTFITWAFNWNVANIGRLPTSIILDDRFQLDFTDLGSYGDLLGPAAAIASLGAIESLLAGLVAGRMTGIKLNANQELVAQGIGNILLPFVGGVPATAAIARMSVNIKAGGVSRVVSFIHSLALLLSVLLFSQVLSMIPMAALAGVLMVTAWRMNEWHQIRFYYSRRLKGPTLVVIVTGFATVALDLTQAIIIGVVLSLFIFLSQVSRLEIVPTEVDWERYIKAGNAVPPLQPRINVVYITGSIYFGAASQFAEQMDNLGEHEVIILSMRGVPVVDISGLHEIEHLWREQTKRGRLLYITGLQGQVRRLFERTGLVKEFGEDKFHWSADHAISSAVKYLAEGRSPQMEAALPGVDENLNEMPLGIATVD